jgi:fatty acid desaturase
MNVQVTESKQISHHDGRAMLMIAVCVALFALAVALVTLGWGWTVLFWLVWSVALCVVWAWWYPRYGNGREK